MNRLGWRRLVQSWVLILPALLFTGCSLFLSTAYKPPGFQPLQVQPWRMIDRAPPGPSGGTLRVSEFGSGPKTFNPILANESSSNDVLAQSFSSLLDYDFRTKKIVGALAYQWTPSKDGKTWLVRLRKGLKWSDGFPLTADDVLFSFKTIYDPKVDNPNRDIAQIKGKPILCEKIDATTVRFRLPGIYGPFPFLLNSIAIVPKHKLEKALANGTFSSAYSVNTPVNEIVSSGAFRITRYVPQQRTVLERNPYFYAKDINGNRLPYLDRIVVQYVPDMNTQFLKFLSGEIDAFPEFPAQFYDDLKEGAKNGNYHVMDLGPLATIPFVVLNENPKSVSPIQHRWFINRLFRQALAYAVNRQAMIRLAFLGHGYPVSQDFTPDSPFYNRKVKPYPYNPEKSRELLKQAGFHWNQGKLFDSTGNRVQFTLLTNSGNVQRRINAELFKEDLEKLGIEVNFHPIDFNQLVLKLDHTFDWQAILIGLIGGSVEPSNNQNVWLSSGFTHEWYPRQKSPATPWEAEIDKLVWEGISTLDLKQRKKIYGRIEEILYNEEVPMILTVTQADLYAFRNTIGNATPTSMGHFWANCSDDMLMAQVYMKKKQ